jgi:nicotinate-nucleotide pyrophosphorylase
MGLYDAILIKDNHVAASGGVGAAVESARMARPDLRIEVECETVDDVREAVHAGADEVLLDNMSPEALREAVRAAGAAVVLEASGGVRLDTVREIAATGVHAISAGALTHSAPAIDFSLELEQEQEHPEHEPGTSETREARHAPRG